MLFNFQERIYEKKEFGQNRAANWYYRSLSIELDGWKYSFKETLFAYEKLLKEGKIRAISASNLNLKQLSNSIRVVHKAVITNIRNLMIHYVILWSEKNIGVIIYYSLNSGFLTGKYRIYEDMITVREMTRLPHTWMIRACGFWKTLDRISVNHHVSQAFIALAWSHAQKEVAGLYCKCDKYQVN